MTPEEKKSAQEISAKATPGHWSFEHSSRGGLSRFSIQVDLAPNMHGPAIMGNISIDMNGLNNLAFVTEARTLLPKALQHISTLEDDIENLKAGFSKSAAPIMTLAEITRAKEIVAGATKGEWTWEDDSQIGLGVVTLYSGRGAMRHGSNLFGRFDTDANRDNNLNFICEARALLPKALDHIETLETEVQRLRKIEALHKQQSRKGAPKP